MAVLHKQPIVAEPLSPLAPVPDLEAVDRRALQRLRFYYGRGRSHHGHQDGIDLDLVTLGLVQYESSPLSGAAARLTVTDVGVQVLAAERERRRSRQRPHTDLASRLARHLQCQGRMTWENVEFRLEDGRAVRPDVYSVVTTLDPGRICPIVHEIKVSRADFLADVSNPDKRTGYFEIADYVIYVCPEGIVDKSDIPDGCGLLIEEGPGLWRQPKRGRKRPTTLRESDWLNLILKRPTFPEDEH